MFYREGNDVFTFSACNLAAQNCFFCSKRTNAGKNLGLIGLLSFSSYVKKYMLF